MADSETTNQADTTVNGGPNGPARAVSSADRTPKASAAQPATGAPGGTQEVESTGSTSRVEGTLDDLSSMREVKGFIGELVDEEADKLRRQRKAEALITAAGPWITKAVAQVGLPPDIANEVWRAVNKMTMAQPQRWACYFVCRHLLKATAATNRAKKPAT